MKNGFFYLFIFSSFRQSVRFNQIVDVCSVMLLILILLNEKKCLICSGWWWHAFSLILPMYSLFSVSMYVHRYILHFFVVCSTFCSRYFNVVQCVFVGCVNRQQQTQKLFIMMSSHNESFKMKNICRFIFSLSLFLTLQLSSLLVMF